jgi:hypothetical protein
VHRNAKARLQALKHPDTPIPGEIVDERRTIEPGGTRLDLPFVGSNHSDNTLVLHLPKEKIIFTVDWIPIQAVLFRDLPDGFIPDGFDGLDRVLAMDRERMILPGTRGPGALRHQGRRARAQGVHDRRVERRPAARGRGRVPRRRGDERRQVAEVRGLGAYDLFLARNVERFCEYRGAATDGDGETNRPPLAGRAECAGRRPSRA